MRKIIVTLVSMLLGLNAVAQNKGIDFLLNKLYDGGKSNYVMIIAHRGNWRNAPENSLQGYKQCIDGGIDGIEIDVHMTKDSAIVIMHDDTLDRTTTGKGLVSDYTLEQIKQLNLKYSNRGCYPSKSTDTGGSIRLMQWQGSYSS